MIIPDACEESRGGGFGGGLLSTVMWSKPRRLNIFAERTFARRISRGVGFEFLAEEGCETNIYD